ncbi:MAG: hypothetical protein JOZ81_31250 [Chloroflexi bacterium]|nr:hypothetical protein [Chloroflexota bacterium]
MARAVRTRVVGFVLGMTIALSLTLFTYGTGRSAVAQAVDSGHVVLAYYYAWWEPEKIMGALHARAAVPRRPTSDR